MSATYKELYAKYNDLQLLTNIFNMKCNSGIKGDCCTPQQHTLKYMAVALNLLDPASEISGRSGGRWISPRPLEMSTANFVGGPPKINRRT